MATESAPKKSEDKYSEDIRKLVVARLKTISRKTSFSIGDDGDFSVEDLITRIEEGDDVGNKIIEMQLDYIRNLRNLPTEA
jgi:hypothetical protein